MDEQRTLWTLCSAGTSLLNHDSQKVSLSLNLVTPWNLDTWLMDYICCWPLRSRARAPLRPSTPFNISQAFALHCCCFPSRCPWVRALSSIYQFSHFYPPPLYWAQIAEFINWHIHLVPFFSCLSSVLSFAYIFVLARWLPLSTPLYLSVACFFLRLSPSTVHYPIWCSNKFDCQSYYRLKRSVPRACEISDLSDPGPRSNSNGEW